MWKVLEVLEVNYLEALESHLTFYRSISISLWQLVFINMMV
jgi:hypothetical protein